MPKTPKHPARFSEGGNVLKGVEIFAAGTHRDKEYSPSDLDAMADNFQRFSVGPQAKLRVPGVLGHEESQELLERSDLPAAAWASKVYRDGPILKADFEDVPESVADLIRSKRYRKVSAEVYDEPPAGIEGRGKMLRRVAFLGGEIPQIKTLADIPMPSKNAERGGAYRPVVLTFSEARPRSGGKTFFVFSEVKPMDRNDMLAKLADLGYDADELKDAPDNCLAEILRVATDNPDEEDEADGDGGSPPPDASNADDDQDASTADMDEAEVAKLPADKQAEYYKAKYAEACKKMAEGDKPDDTPAKPEGAEKMSEKRIASLVAREVQKALKANVKGSIDQLNKFREQVIAADKKKAVTAFCEEMRSSGKLAPAEFDQEVEFQLTLDAQTVHKFTEKGKAVSKTQLERAQDRIRSRPSLFAERVKGAGKGGRDDDRKTEEEREAEAHFERFSEEFAKAGQSKDDFLKVFKAAPESERRRMIDDMKKAAEAA